MDISENRLWYFKTEERQVKIVHGIIIVERCKLKTFLVQKLNIEIVLIF